MADDFKFRSTRSNDPYQRGADPSRPIDFSNNSDPLAELARLIGQNDPHAEYTRSSSRASQPRDVQPRDLPPRDLPRRDLPPRDLLPRDLPSRDVPQRGYPTSQAAPDWPPSPLNALSDRRYESEPRSQGRDSYPALGDYPSSRSAGREPIASDDYSSARAGRDPFASSAPREDYAARSAPSAPREEPRWAPREEPRWAPEPPHYGDTQKAPVAQDPGYSDDPVHAAAADGEDEGYYQDDAPLQPEDEELYDDAPSAYRRSGIATVLALIGCALLGTAGAYAYRSYAHPPAKEPPPVISADNSTPSKVAPPAAGEARSNKQISDRFATAGTGNEQLVSRQEEPVALPGTATAPRVVLPAPVQPAQPVQPPPAFAPPVQAAAPPQPSAATPPAPGSEPKRIRTVTIRPDGDPSGRPVANNTTPPAPRATTGTTPPAPRATTTPPAPRSGGPLSLEPNEPRSRTANAPPPPTSLSSFSPSGGFVVQLSSQKTENEAHSSFRALQAKFPGELGNRQVIIRRADLGAKGVVYRTNVGPFATAAEAQRFCSSYKAAGGQCIVPTN